MKIEFLCLKLLRDCSIKWWSQVWAVIKCSQAFFLTSGKKHKVYLLTCHSIPFKEMLSILSMRIYTYKKITIATDSHTFLGICWICCTAHFFTLLSATFCLMPTPTSLFTDFPVSASVSREVNTGLFDESDQKQPADLPWHAHTHTETVGKCHVWIKQCFS